jgi:hypothetical protein
VKYTIAYNDKDNTSTLLRHGEPVGRPITNIEWEFWSEIEELRAENKKLQALLTDFINGVKSIPGNTHRTTETGTSRMLKANFERALLFALQRSRQLEDATGIRESCFAGGVKEILEASQRGEQIQIREE